MTAVPEHWYLQDQDQANGDRDLSHSIQPNERVSVATKYGAEMIRQPIAWITCILGYIAAGEAALCDQLYPNK